MRLFAILFSLSFFFTACSTQSNTNPREYQVGAYLWQQTSGEYRALTYQAYNWAQRLVERDLENKHNKKRAVIFDIDETVLDNTFSGAREIKDGIPWKEELFNEWVKLRKAVAIPGALEFIKFLEANNVEVFYISNRRVEDFDPTFANLQAEGFPVKKENLLLKTNTSGKEVRRQEVDKKHEIVILVGDNLTDFHKDFDKTTTEERNALVKKWRAEFGTRYIVLPNPLYGDWERALPHTKDRLEHLKLNP